MPRFVLKSLVSVHKNTDVAPKVQRKEVYVITDG